MTRFEAWHELTREIEREVFSQKSSASVQQALMDMAAEALIAQKMRGWIFEEETLS